MALSCRSRFDRRSFPPSSAGAGTGEPEMEPPAGMSPAEAMAFLASGGFPVTPSEAVESEEGAVAAAKRIGFPVAVKMNSRDVTHKSDVGGVILDVCGEDGVREAYRSVRDAAGRAGAGGAGALVAAMAAPGVEAIVGVTKDPQFGHAVMFGLGGILVEVMKDVSFGIVPLSRRDAEEMVAEIRGGPVLGGVRGNPPVDREALLDHLLQVSDFVSRHPEIEEMDLNPVILHGKGLTVADCRIVLAGEGT